MTAVKNNKGSTSILIIMLMVVLMIFGLTILTTTLSNENLSLKKQSWLVSYYELEVLAADQLAAIDQKTELIKAGLDEHYDTPAEYKKELVEKFDGVVESNGHYYKDIVVSETSGEYLKHIYIRIEWIIPELGVSFVTNRNFDVLEYVQVQDYFEYDDIEFGTPFAPE